MSLLDDARWMAHNRPHEIGEACWYCNAGQPEDSYLEVPPKPDCPWLSMPRIVAVLEAAERVQAAADDPWGDEQTVANAAYDLVAALRGDAS